MEPTIPRHALTQAYAPLIRHGESPRLDARERTEFLRARECTTPPAALRLQAICRYEPRLLPRYHPDDRGWQNRSRGFHQLAPAGAYSRIQTWLSRNDWLDVVVPIVCQLGVDVLRKHSVSIDFMRRWAAVKSAYAHHRTGRRCIVRPKVLAGVLMCQERQVQRANAAARELGLEVVVLRGRMLTYEETAECRRRGSTQRGLASEVALTVPAAYREQIDAARARRQPPAVTSAVDSDTPTSGGCSSQESHLGVTNPCAARGAKKDGASRRHRRRGAPHPAWPLARTLVRLVPWLRQESPRRLLGALRPFATAALPWTAHDVQLAMGMQATRSGAAAHITPAGAKVPWALLRHVLAQIDPYADHPRLPELEEATWERPAVECNHPDCDGYGWHNTPTGAVRCPAAQR